MPLFETAPLRFAQIRVGMHFQTSTSFGPGEMDSFESQTGDASPLHVSDRAAQQLGYPGRLVYGFLTLGQLSGFVGRYLHQAICVSVSADFVHPAYVGEKIDLDMEVAQIQPAMRIVLFRTSFRRGDSMVIRGKLTVRFLEDAEGALH